MVTGVATATTGGPLDAEGKVSRVLEGGVGGAGSSIQVAADRTEISISPRAEITQRPIES